MSNVNPDAGKQSPLSWLALLVALVTSAGSLYLSAGMGLVACPLCFYQRTFALGAFGVLLIGLLGGMGRWVSLPALALPLAVGGLSVAGFHAWLEFSGKLECPGGVFDLGSAPQQSAAALGLLTLVLLADVLVPGRAGSGVVSLVGGLVLGGLFATGCIFTSSPPCKVDPEAYKSPPKGCRPVQPKE